MEGEEAAALAAYRSARRQHPACAWSWCPGTPSDSTASPPGWWRTESPWSVAASSASEKPARGSSGLPPIILIDTIGELAAVWGLADIAFVGGSLVPGRGGQNMMEPAAYGASVMFGPHTANFRETVEQLLARQAACRVADADELKLRLLQDLDDPEAAAARGEAGRSFVLAQHGASGRTLSRAGPTGRVIDHSKVGLNLDCVSS